MRMPYWRWRNREQANMRLLVINNTATDLVPQNTPPGQPAPFQPNYDVIAFNPDSGTVVVETSPDDGSYTSVGTVPANGFLSINLNNRYIKVSTAKTVYLLGN
jgi:hypothetical protein